MFIVCWCTFSLNHVISLVGDWIAIGVHLVKHFKGTAEHNSTDGQHLLVTNNTNGTGTAKIDDLLAYLNLQGLPHYLVMAITGSFFIYFGSGGFIHVSGVSQEIVYRFKDYNWVSFFSGITTSTDGTDHRNGSANRRSFYLPKWNCMKYSLGDFQCLSWAVWVESFHAMLWIMADYWPCTIDGTSTVGGGSLVKY